MPNKTYVVEWITFAYKNLATAKLIIVKDRVNVR